MSAKAFVDANVLVYAHDIDERSKRAVARKVLRDLWNDGTGVVSPQVLQEFYVNVTRKIVVPISRQAARQVVGAYALWCTDVTSSDVAAAFRIEDEAAAKSGAAKLLTEDLNPDQIVAGVMIENPFAIAL